jgi:hypothetical protein
MSKIINIQVAFVHGKERRGMEFHITVPAKRDMSVKDVRGYILKCAKGEDGTRKNHEAISILIEKSGVDVDSIGSDPIQIKMPIVGEFMETEVPNCPIVERTHVLFLHPKPIR